jgi:DtxR family Mn-dependent transcriptional regulator
MMLSQAVQDYLKTIYRLQTQDGVVFTSALAEAMKVTAASATGMVKKLANLKLVRHNPYQGVVLSKIGEKAALEIIRHHRLLELYLAETLGYAWDQVHDEAEQLEHVISEELEERIFEALGRPIRDPHGEPIPARDGTMRVPRHDRLSDLQPGTAGIIRQVSEPNAEMLRYLGSRGLVPDAPVKVLERAPFNGPITVELGETSHVLGRDLASHILVQAHNRGGAVAGGRVARSVS